MVLDVPSLFIYFFRLGMFLVISSSANTVKCWWKQTSCVGQKAEKIVDPSTNTDEVCSLIPSAVARFSFFKNNGQHILA